MTRRNPPPALQPGVFEETFSTGVLDSSKWTVNTGVASGSNVAAYNHLGWFSDENVTLDEGVLTLKLTQKATSSSGSWNASTNTPTLTSGTGTAGAYYSVSTNGSTTLDGITSWTTSDKALFDGSVWRKVTGTAPAYISSGAEISSIQSFGYGTYEYIIKSSTSSTVPTSDGTPVSGSISKASVFYNSETVTSLLFQVNANATADLRNYWQLWSENTAGLTTASVLSKNPETYFSSLKYIWSPGQVEFYVNGKLITITTTNVPVTPGVVRFSHYGNNDANLGGIATPDAEREMYVSYFKYTPPDDIRFFGFGVDETVVDLFTLAPVAAEAIPVLFEFTVNSTVLDTFILQTASGVGVTRPFSFSVTHIVTDGFVMNTALSQVGLVRSFTFATAEHVTDVFSMNTYSQAVQTETGWLNPTAVSATGWTNTLNVFASDDARMTATAAANTETPELYVSGFAGLDIPEGSTIDGIRVKVEGGVTAGSVDYSYFRLIHLTNFLPKSANEKELVLGTLTASSTDTGWITAGSQYLTGWTDGVDALVQDGDNAYVNVTAAETPYAVINDFNATAVPSGATINGIEVRINGRSTVATDIGDYSYFYIGEVVGGTLYSVNAKTCTLPVHATTNQWVIMGGPTDLWGGKPGGGSWVPADFADANFGIAGAWFSTPANQFNIDGVQMKVYYTPEGGTEGSVTLGSTTDLWGNTDTNDDNVFDRYWSATDFTSDFAFWGAFAAGINGATIAIDNIQLNVSYTTPGSNPGGVPAVHTDTGWVPPTANANTVGWTNPANVYAAGDATASFTAGETPYIRYHGFTGLAVIPGDATVDGIEVKMTGRTSAAATSYFFVGDVIAGSPQSVTNQPCPLPVHASVNGDVIVGGDGDLWGGSDAPAPWVPADIQSPDFGVSGAWVTTPANTVNLDSLFMKVYYTTAGAPAPGSPAPPPPAPGGKLAIPNKIVATMHIIWPGPTTTIPDIHSSYNQIYLFHCLAPFVGGTAEQIGNGAMYLKRSAANSDWGAYGTESAFDYTTAFTIQQLADARAAGKRIVLTCGGANAGWNYTTATQATNLVNSLKYIIDTQCGGNIDGVCFNNFENGTGSDPVIMNSIASQLKVFYGNSFSIDATPHPNAATHPIDRDIVQYMATRGNMDFVSPQFYEGPGTTDPSFYPGAIDTWQSYWPADGKAHVVLGVTSGSTFGGSYSWTTTAQTEAMYDSRPTKVRGVFGWTSGDDEAQAWDFGIQLKAHMGAGGSAPVPPPPPPAPSPPPPSPPPPSPPGTVMPIPTKILGTYLSPYGGGGDVAMANTMAQLVTQKYNQVHLFHAVPWGHANDWQGDTGIVILEQQWSLFITAARVQALRNAGIRCIMTVGGQGWQMRFDSTAKENNFMASIDALYAQLGGFDGIDFNTFEAGQFVQPSSNMISLSQKLKAKYGSNFSISCPPAHYSQADMALVQAWNAASNGAYFDFVTPQIYDDRSGPGAGIYTQSVMYNATVKWLPYVGNNPAKLTMGTGSNFYWGASNASNAAAWNQMKNGGSSTYIRGVVGWSTVDDQNAGSPWSFANTMKPIL